MIFCRTLGPVEVSIDGANPPAELLWRKNFALLIYLARSPKRTRTREHLMGLLWAEKPEPSARHSLREAVRILRRSIGEEGIVTEHDQIQLAADAVQLDTDEFDRSERAAEWSGAAELLAGDFLEGFSIPDSSGFEDWLGAERMAWRRRGVTVLVNLADEHLGHGHTTEAADVSLRALELDPTSDGAVRAAMRALALAGDRAGALTHYERFEEQLEALGTAPNEETQGLAARVRKERTWRLSKEVPTGIQQGAESRRTPLIGRERDLEELVAAWRECVDSRRAAVGIIEADTGMGKTRLAEELLSRARLDGAAAASVRAVEADLDSTFSGVLGLACGGLLGASGLAGAAPSALAAFAAEIPEWADRFGAVSEPPAPLGAALSEMLRAVVEEQPVFVLVDDAQWLDRDSLLALVAAARDLARTPVFTTFSVAPRPPRDELDDLRSRIGRDVPGVAVRLGPLSDDALRQLAEWALPSYDDKEIDRLTRRIAADSAGLPLLAVELLHAVALGLDLGTITGAWPEPFKTLDQSLPDDLPDAVVAAIRIGFRRLTNDAQRVLAAAAVIGGRLGAPHLERATGISSDALLSALDELEWQRWLTAEPRGSSFVAGIVRDVVERDMLTEGQRKRNLDCEPSVGR